MINWMVFRTGLDIWGKLCQVFGQKPMTEDCISMLVSSTPLYCRIHSLRKMR